MYKSVESYLESNGFPLTRNFLRAFTCVKKFRDNVERLALTCTQVVLTLSLNFFTHVNASKKLCVSGNPPLNKKRSLREQFDWLSEREQVTSCLVGFVRTQSNACGLRVAGAGSLLTKLGIDIYSVYFGNQ